MDPRDSEEKAEKLLARKAETRETRLAQALRANLRRRKAGEAPKAPGDTKGLEDDLG